MVCRWPLLDDVDGDGDAGTAGGANAAELHASHMKQSTPPTCTLCVWRPTRLQRLQRTSCARQARQNHVDEPSSDLTRPPTFAEPHDEHTAPAGGVLRLGDSTSRAL